MGQDIHCYVEYGRPAPNGEMWWAGFGGRINPGRNYMLFGLLSDGGRGDGPPLFPNKGLPDNLGYDAQRDAFLLINDEHADQENWCTLAEAEMWAKHGGKIIDGPDGKPQKVEHPDWHGHTWLDADEFGQVLVKYAETAGGDAGAEYWALLAAMKSLASHGHQVRIVIWFDN